MTLTSFSRSRTTWLLFLVAVACCKATQVFGEIRYSLTDLGTLGGVSSYAYGINNLGQVVGTADTTTVDPYLGRISHAFLYSGGAITDLGDLGGGFANQSYAYGINDAGQVVGKSYRYASRAFLWANGTMSDLGTLGGNDAIARAIDNNGRIVGGAATPYGMAPFLYSNGSMIGLSVVGTGVAYGINTSGQVAGELVPSYLSSNPNHAFLWANGTGGDIGTLGGTVSAAMGINASGQVVGFARPFGDNTTLAFSYKNGQMSSLGTLYGSQSEAFGINSAAVIVGESDGLAFVYQNGTMHDLNLLVDPTAGWTLNSANAINDVGQIVGYGINSSGQTHAFLLTPIPEPSAGVLFVGGAGVIYFRPAQRRRRG